MGRKRGQKKILILCEKRLVALQFVKALESRHGRARKKGLFFEVGPYIVAYAQGHLVEIADDVVSTRWRLEELPVFPEKFRYIPREGTERLLKELVRAIRQSDIILNCGDSGREGELVIRLILKYAGWKDWKKVYRFWTSKALTDEVILSVLENGLKPAEKFDSLYYSALARQHADFISGVNLTRLVTLTQEKNRGDVWSVGRVQTPTLRLVVERDIAIESFRPVPYFLLKCRFSRKKLTWEGVFVRSSLFKKKAEDVFAEKSPHADLRNLPENALTGEEAERVLKIITSERTGVIAHVSLKETTEPPPGLFSLASLQAEANRLYGFSSGKTLELAQRLYEEYRVISYPRTDSEYLPANAVPEVRNLLRTLTPGSLRNLIDWSRVSESYRKVFDDSKITDHHALIPQGRCLDGVGSDLQKIYTLILKRFLAAFMRDSMKLSVEIHVNVKGALFKTVKHFVTVAGWRKVYGIREEVEKAEGFKNLKKELHERGKIVVLKGKCSADERKTLPPSRYTEGSLIREMKARGLGTAATRSAIIDRLKEVGYLHVKDRKLVSTAKGRKLILDIMKESSFSSVDITSEWERRLNEIYENNMGREGYRLFMRDIKSFVKSEVEKLKRRLSADGKGERGETEWLS